MYEVESSFGGVAGFSPLDLANLRLFWDFRDTDSYTLSGANVASIHDLGGAAPDFTAVSSPRGEITSGQLVLTSDNYTTPSSSYWNFLHNGANWSIHLALESNKAGGTFGGIFSNNSFSTPIGFGLAFDGRTPNMTQTALLYIRGSGTTVISNFADSPANWFTQNVFTQNTLLYDYATATAGNDVAFFYKDGSLIGNSNLDSKTASVTTASQPLLFGSDVTGGSASYFNAKITGIVITESLLDSTEISNLNTYFS